MKEISEFQGEVVCPRSLGKVSGTVGSGRTQGCWPSGHGSPCCSSPPCADEGSRRLQGNSRNQHPLESGSVFTAAHFCPLWPCYLHSIFFFPSFHFCLLCFHEPNALDGQSKKSPPGEALKKQMQMEWAPVENICIDGSVSVSSISPGSELLGFHSKWNFQP